MSSQTLDQVIATYVAAGYQVVNRGDSYVNLKKPRQWNRLGIGLFVALPLLIGLFVPVSLGVAVFGLIFVTADYLLRKEQNAYITADQAQNGTVPTPVQNISAWGKPAIVGLVLVGLFLIWVLSFFLRF